MYQPRHFAAPNDAGVHDLVRNYPLAQVISLCGETNASLFSNPAPLIAPAGLSIGERLIGHVARANDLWQSKNAVLVVFTGPSHYISPNAYPSKQSNPRVVPTFNYATVQVVGELVACHESARKLEIVTAMTQQFEADQLKPWALTDAPAQYIDQMLNAIVGIEITIKEIRAKFKLSQNRGQEDRLGVMRYLEQKDAIRNTVEMLKMMQTIEQNP
jgi:transcriptional regulator